MGEESWIDIGDKKRLTIRKFKGERFLPPNQMANYLSPYHEANNTWISERYVWSVIGDFSKRLTDYFMFTVLRGQGNGRQEAGKEGHISGCR